MPFSSRSYFSAIYTPFSVILFYEVLMLIAALPQSATHSIAKQFEIVSLIFVRRFFHDIAEIGDVGQLTRLTQETLPIFLDIGAGLVMFLLVTVFLRIARRWTAGSEASARSPEVAKFIQRKKGLALGLTAILVCLVAYNLFRLIRDLYQQVYPDGTTIRLDMHMNFFTDVFAVMIFTDVLIVIFSLSISGSYGLVFRNAMFVVSTILIRLSLSAAGPYSVLLALAGIASGIVTLLIYDYHLSINPVVPRSPGLRSAA